MRHQIKHSPPGRGPFLAPTVQGQDQHLFWMETPPCLRPCPAHILFPNLFLWAHSLGRQSPNHRILVRVVLYVEEHILGRPYTYFPGMAPRVVSDSMALHTS